MESTTRQSGSSRLLTLALTVAVIGLSILVLVLARQSASLRRELDATVQQFGELSLPIGETVTALDCHGTDTQPSDCMRFDDGRLATALYIFKSQCGACALSEPIVQDLARTHAQGGVRFVALQADAPGQLKSMGEHIQVCTAGNPGATWVRRVPLVPAMLLIDAKGVVREAWYGSPHEAHLRRMAAAIEHAEGNRLDSYSPFAHEKARDK